MQRKSRQLVSDWIWKGERRQGGLPPKRIKMDYSIGSVAKLLGLSVEGVRNYEKYEIITPKRTDSNYRKYSYLDITSLIRAKAYRSLGFSLKETSLLTNDMQIPQIVDSMLEKRRGLDQECALIQAKIAFLDENMAEFEALDQHLNQPRIKMSPGFYRFEYGKNGVISFDDDSVSTFQSWMEYAPFVHISTRYSNGSVYGGLAIQEKYARLFDIRENDRIKYLPGGLHICVKVMEPDNGFSDINCTEALKQYAAYHRYEISQDLMGHTILGITKKQEYRRYREVSAKILSETY